MGGIGPVAAFARLNRPRLGGGMALAVLALGFPWVSPSYYATSVVIDVYVMALYAMSFDLLMGYTGLLSFGHTLFFGLGGYTVALLMKRAGWVFAAALAAAVVVAVLAGVAFGVLALRVRGVYFAMVTLAFAELARLAVEKLSRITGGADGLPGIPTPAFLNHRLTFYYVALAVLAVAFWLLRRLVNSPIGRVLVAIRENEARAAAIGYNVFAYKLIAIIVGGTLAAVAGILHALFFAYVSPGSLGIDNTINVLLMTIIGGAGTLVGPILGATVVRVMGAVLSTHVERWVLVFGLVYVAIVMFMPQGLLGSWRVVRLREPEGRGG